MEALGFKRSRRDAERGPIRTKGARWSAPPHWRDEKMKKAVYHGIRDIRVEQVEEPEPGPGEAKVRVV